MINLNNIDKNSYHIIQACFNLIQKETKNYKYKTIIVFTDEVEIIKNKLTYVFNLNNINVNNYTILPLSYKIRYENIVFEDTIIFEIIECFGLYKLHFLDKTSYVKYNSSDDFIEVITRIYDYIIEGEILW